LKRILLLTDSDHQTLRILENIKKRLKIIRKLISLKQCS